jgi:uncharacterized protein involved in exopolysaccharide biosynthesis
MAKFLEIFFRHKFWFVVPPLLVTIVASVITYVTSPLMFVSSAGIWVDRPTYLTYSDNWNSWASPAQNQTSRLTELLKTQTFVVDVAKRTSLAPLTTTQRGLERIDLILAQGFGVLPVGTHLVTVSFRSDNPQIAYEMLKAVVDAFNDSIANDSVNQAAIATAFYSDQLQQAQDDLGKASDDLRRYIQTNPSLASSLDSTNFGASFTVGGGSVVGPSPKAVLDQAATTDGTLAQLRSKVQNATDRVAQLQASLQSAEYQASASVQGQQLGFQVVDAPNYPTTGGRDLKKRMMFPIIAFAGSLAVSGLALALMAMSNRTVQSETDLATGVRVVGDVPYMRLKKPVIYRRLSTRQAIGFVAGVALPAPKGAK